MTILKKIIESTRLEVAERKRRFPLAECRALAESLKSGSSFREQITRPQINIIAEVKKASPSRGVICGDFNPVTIAREYKAGGAAAISVLTERRHFQGSLDYLDQIAAKVPLPLLRKDFIIDAYQLYEAKVHHAGAVLLIAALQNEAQLNDLLAVCEALKVDALVEVHTARELEAALRTDARIIGVNNRNLKTFDVDLQTSFELAPLIPQDCTKVSESGISSHDDIARLAAIGYDAFLVGESLMRQPNRVDALKALRGNDVH